MPHFVMVQKVGQPASVRLTGYKPTSVARVRHLARAPLREAIIDLGMAPISPDTASQALRFALLLPNSLPIPELPPDPDGDISFGLISKTATIFSPTTHKPARI